MDNFPLPFLLSHLLVGGICILWVKPELLSNRLVRGLILVLLAALADMFWRQGLRQM